MEKVNREEAKPSLPEVVGDMFSRAFRLLGNLALRFSDILDNKKGGEVVGDMVVDEIAPNGLGFGGGSISGESSKNGIDKKILDDAAQEILKQDYYKTIEAKDSGCGDGRPVKSVWAKLKSKFNGSRHQLEASESKIRPKLFGGDFATLYTVLAVATEEGRGAETFGELDEQVIEVFNQMNWVLGTHNDDHGDGPDDLHGCGAIDNRQKILANSQQFKNEIQETLEKLGLFNQEASDKVNGVFSSRNEVYFEGYNGAQRQAYLEEDCDNVVRKVLAGSHQEAFVVINTRKGVTFDQESFRQSMVDKYGADSKLPQVFVVDIWQAESMIDKLIEKGHIEANQKSVAMAAVLTYTLATAATLTDGTLPVFLAK